MFLQYLPKPLLTPDQVELLQTDNVVSRAGANAKAARCRPRHRADAMEVIVPSYLWRFRKTGQFSRPTALKRDYFPSASAISPSAPTTTRHQANSAKPWRCT